MASLVGGIVPGKAIAAGKAIRDIDIPQDCVVAAIIRDKDFVVPGCDTKIEVRDQVIFVGPSEGIKNAYDNFLLQSCRKAMKPV